VSVRVRERVYSSTRTTTWQADIHVKLLNGRRIRERTKVPGAKSRSAALRWAQARERWLILHGHEAAEIPAAGAEVPTLAVFCERFISEYVLANRLKPSTIYNKKKIIELYLLPNLGELRLHKISESDVQRLKARYSYQAAASVNNMLTLLGTMLKTAKEWGLVETIPRIRKLRQSQQRFSFYDEETFERLVAAAAVVDTRSLSAVLLGGDAGLRGGEITALRLVHCDLRRGVLNIVENDWRGHIRLPKGNRPRQVVMTERLRRHLRGIMSDRDDHETRVILRDDGRDPSKRVIDGLIRRAQRAALLPPKGPHILRHTFCSRLAARGASPKAIQELAGHVHSVTTDRYMHLAPSALRTAIALIEPEPESMTAPGTDPSRVSPL